MASIAGREKICRWPVMDWVQSLQRLVGRTSFLMFLLTTFFRDNIRGPLSLFTNISGESTVEISRRRIPVKEDFFFLSNYDQHYTLEIEKGKRAETFNIHFGDYFCDQVFSSLSQKPDQLLNSYFQEPSERLEFHNKIYHRDELTQNINYGNPTRCWRAPAWLEEKLYALIENLLKKEKDLIQDSVAFSCSEILNTRGDSQANVNSVGLHSYSPE